MKAPTPENVAFSSFGKPWMIVVRGKRGMAFDRWLVRHTGLSLVSLQYSLAGGYRYQRTLLLSMVGAKTGDLRSVALPYVIHGDSYVVVASKGGGAVNPDWVANLRKHPQCWLHIGRKRVPALAHVAEGAEREALYPFVCERKRNVARYQERASGFGREIPLVVLTPNVAVMDGGKK